MTKYDAWYDMIQRLKVYRKRDEVRGHPLVHRFSACGVVMALPQLKGHSLIHRYEYIENVRLST